MPRRADKRPVRALPTPAFAISDADWANFERIQKREMPPAAREELSDVTRRMIAFSNAERHAVPVKCVHARLLRMRRAAESLRMELTKLDDSTLAARNLLEARFGPLEQLVGALIVFDAESRHAALEMSDVLPPHRDGAAWEIWVQDLTMICKKHRLPRAVRKDTDKRIDDVPPFFEALVGMLQKVIPREHRRQGASSISRARKSRVR